MFKKVEFSTNSPEMQPTMVSPQVAEEEPSVFMEEDGTDDKTPQTDGETTSDGKKKYRVVNGKEREIVIKKGGNGDTIRTTSDTGEELVTGKTTGKNTYMTRRQFDIWVRAALNTDEVPEGIKPELREYGIVFIDEKTGLTMGMDELNADPRVIAAQEQKQQRLDMERISKQIEADNKKIFDEIGDELEALVKPNNFEVGKIEADKIITDMMKSQVNNNLPELAKVLPKEELNGIIQEYFDITKPSNATGADLDKVLANTPMHGLGNHIKELEAKYKINAYMLMGVTRTESSYGQHTAEGTSNNVGGIKIGDGTNNHREYTSFAESVEGIAKLLSGNLYVKDGKTTPKSISSRYCPPNHEAWSFLVSDTIQNLSSRFEPKP